MVPQLGIAKISCRNPPENQNPHEGQAMQTSITINYVSFHSPKHQAHTNNTIRERQFYQPPGREFAGMCDGTYRGFHSLRNILQAPRGIGFNCEGARRYVSDGGVMNYHSKKITIIFGCALGVCGGNISSRICIERRKEIVVSEGRLTENKYPPSYSGRVKGVQEP